MSRVCSKSDTLACTKKVYLLTTILYVFNGNFLTRKTKRERVRVIYYYWIAYDVNRTVINS